jgi:hypothetical protein
VILYISLESTIQRPPETLCQLLIGGGDHDLVRVFRLLNLHHPLQRVDVAGDGVGVLVDQQLEAELLGHPLAHLVHRLELPGRVDVQQRERRLRREEGLGSEVQHHRRILADGIEHHRPFALGDDLAQDVDALGLEALQVGEHLGGSNAFGCGRVGRDAGVHGRTLHD